MPIFMVRCYTDAKPEGDYRKIEADDKLQAAEKACGGPLIEGAKPGNLRAMVWSPDDPNRKTSFAGHRQ